ncbi:MAG TPA: YqgE/AlgH family protein [Burkholderiales bacterium]|nr:YqgE/AlgH family protein [Burkholderiales bacterium]
MRALRLGAALGLTAGFTASALAAPERTAAPPPAIRPVGVGQLSKGKLLVASPNLVDPNFAESVLVVLEYGPDGAIGVVVNRDTDVPISEAMQQVPELKQRPDTLHLGGPIDPFRVLLLVRSRKRPEDSLQLLDDVYVTGSLEALKRLLAERKDKAQFRLFAGYAGWGGGQLEAEVRRGDWLVGEGDAGAIFDRDPDGLWKRLVERLAGQWVRSGPNRSAEASPVAPVAWPLPAGPIAPSPL